jgi:aspartokinase-like uncharacterized kinase
MKGRWLRGLIRENARSEPGQECIIKLGGSLLQRPAWPEEFAAILTTLTSPVIIVGGGPVVDGLRVIDAACQQSRTLMHDLAIDAMRLTARIVADALGLPIVPSIDPPCSGPVILDAAAWLGSHPSAGLPQGWEVTSDSIAATVAAANGRQLLLAKSIPPPCSGDDLANLAAAGWVDGCFPAAATAIERISWASPA